MPGTIGGAVWMNARCYGSEIADVLSWVDVVGYWGSGLRFPPSPREWDSVQEVGVAQSPHGQKNLIQFNRVMARKEEFGYKQSPFQNMDCLILAAGFNLKQGDKAKIKNQMEKNRKDRKEKGHYQFPCAGSAFKNNRDFGKPTGQIIDELGLRGFSIGGAQAAPFHGNIIINKGNATAADIRALMDEVTIKVKKNRFRFRPGNNLCR